MATKECRYFPGVHQDIEEVLFLVEAFREVFINESDNIRKIQNYQAEEAELENLMAEVTDSIYDYKLTQFVTTKRMTLVNLD